ncbi:Dual specificity protein phosphatase 16 [Balamuthia mandrillaris]
MGGKPSHILGTTFIQGGSDVLRDGEWFRSNGVTDVVSICDVYPDRSIISEERNIWIDLYDVESTNLLDHFERTTRFIHKARASGGCVYVHCAAGISRSSTISSAYLMCWLELTMEEALQVLKLSRPAVSPNRGFREQLKRFETSELRNLLVEEFRKEREANGELQKLYEADQADIAQKREAGAQQQEKSGGASGSSNSYFVY